MTDTPAENAARKQRGRSGNPSGKPKGTRNRATRAVEALLDGEAEALTRKAIDLALAGDIPCLRENSTNLLEVAGDSAGAMRYVVMVAITIGLADCASAPSSHWERVDGKIPPPQ